MEEVLRALNELVRLGVVGNYAIGGAIGAAFYIEAAETEDVDAFVFLPPSASGLVSLAPVYEALLALGGKEEREYVRFGDWPLQILTDANDLVRDAIGQAVEAEFGGVATRVFSAEHLCAIALQTGRSKDFLRVTMFLEQGAVDVRRLQVLAERFGFEEKLARVLDGRRVDDR